MVPDKLGGSSLNKKHGFHAVIAVEEILAFAKSPFDLAQVLEIFQHDFYHAVKRWAVAS